MVNDTDSYNASNVTNNMLVLENVDKKKQIIHNYIWIFSFFTAPQCNCSSTLQTVIPTLNMSYELKLMLKPK